LGPIIGGRYKGRVDPSEITLFKSLGLGIEDLAVALKVFQKAKAEGLGQEIEW
jgi:ornithine cyclodeaminase/alanine dehydrogenase-like protein (mu-crystallin family)